MFKDFVQRENDMSKLNQSLFESVNEKYLNKILENVDKKQNLLTQSTVENLKTKIDMNQLKDNNNLQKNINNVINQQNEIKEQLGIYEDDGDEKDKILSNAGFKREVSATIQESTRSENNDDNDDQKLNMNELTQSNSPAKQSNESNKISSMMTSKIKNPMQNENNQNNSKNIVNDTFSARSQDSEHFIEFGSSEDFSSELNRSGSRSRRSSTRLTINEMLKMDPKKMEIKKRVRERSISNAASPSLSRNESFSSTSSMLKETIPMTPDSNSHSSNFVTPSTTSPLSRESSFYGIQRPQRKRTTIKKKTMSIENNKNNSTVNQQPGSMISEMKGIMNETKKDNKQFKPTQHQTKSLRREQNMKEEDQKDLNQIPKNINPMPQTMQSNENNQRRGRRIALEKPKNYSLGSKQMNEIVGRIDIPDRRKTETEISKMNKEINSKISTSKSSSSSEEKENTEEIILPVVEEMKQKSIIKTSTKEKKDRIKINIGNYSSSQSEEEQKQNNDYDGMKKGTKIKISSKSSSNENKNEEYKIVQVTNDDEESFSEG